MRTGLLSVATLILGLLVSQTVANATSFDSLVNDGYHVYPLGKGRSGGLGWLVSKGDKRYFCRLGASLAYSGKSGMVSFTSSGRMIQLDRATYDASVGGHDSTLPKLEDLKAGRVRPQDVTFCSSVSK